MYVEPEDGRRPEEQSLYGHDVTLTLCRKLATMFGTHWSFWPPVRILRGQCVIAALEINERTAEIMFLICGEKKGDERGVMINKTHILHQMVSAGLHSKDEKAKTRGA